MLPVLDVILGHKSAHSLAAGPMLAGLYLICFVYCVLCFYLQNKDTPSLLPYDFCCQITTAGWTFFLDLVCLNCGITISLTLAAGSQFSCLLVPFTEMVDKFLVQLQGVSL